MMFGNGSSGVCPWCGAGYSSTDMVLLFLFGLLVLAGVIVLVIWAVRALGGGGTAERHPSDDTAMRVARERLARGELTKEQFDDIVRALGG